MAPHRRWSGRSKSVPDLETLSPSTWPPIGLSTPSAWPSSWWLLGKWGATKNCVIPDKTQMVTWYDWFMQWVKGWRTPIRTHLCLESPPIRRLDQDVPQWRQDRLVSCFRPRFHDLSTCDKTPSRLLDNGRYSRILPMLPSMLHHILYVLLNNKFWRKSLVSKQVVKLGVVTGLMAIFWPMEVQWVLISELGVVLALHFSNVVSPYVVSVVVGAHVVSLASGAGAFYFYGFSVRHTKSFQHYNSLWKLYWKSCPLRHHFWNYSFHQKIISSLYLFTLLAVVFCAIFCKD